MQPIEIQDFVIRESSVLCPSCLTPFATPLLEKMPDITPETTVEADLHRVLPDASIRGALIAICPACIFTSWSSAFGMHFFVPELLVPAPQIEYPKKFAHAVLTGRNNGAHPLDRAMLALNGCWCARETYIGATQEQLAGYQAENERWLTLASQEMEIALNDTSWNGNRARYSYLQGEILRQLGDFHGAVRYFDMVNRDCLLPVELVRHQRTLAVDGNPVPIVLPPHLVEQIFLPKPLIMPTPQGQSQNIPPQLVQTSNYAS